MIVEGTSAMSGTALRHGTSNAMIANERSGTIATGMKIIAGKPATIEAIAMDGSLLDLRPCRHFSARAGGSVR
jgi:hypothetical protein